jgi:alkylation response protein AidB-like acyl-CoA dehydrogenase
MGYRAPVSDIVFAMRHVADLDQGIADGLYADLADGVAEATLAEAGKLAENVLAPLNRLGDKTGAQWTPDGVRTVPGWPAAYKQWIEGGWNGLGGPAEYGGMALPTLIGVACTEIWNGANMSFGLCPLLTVGAIEAMHAHASEALKARYFEKLVSGEWTGTMNLTEPQSGSDLSTLRTRAEPQGDGSYKLFGSKIFITYGDHDLTENIIHFVLARLPDAPPGTRGISLFLVPKMLVNDDGTLGARNDVRCASIEHKLGIHASPTCTMVYGDAGGATGWLVGEPNKGLACMFTMMNNARLNVGVQGVGIAEAATQHARAYAAERKQGRAPGAAGASPIDQHPDVQRMLVTMKAMTAAARAICLLTARAIDASRRLADPAARQAANERAGLLTPLAKALSSDIANEVASLGVQIHGGMGFMEETGAAQFMRDARIAAIYEGTNGIQAIDLVQRKLGLSDGAAMAAEVVDMRATLAALRETNAESFGRMGQRLTEAVDSLERATQFMREAATRAPADALAGATPYLRLFGYARGGTALAKAALAAHRLARSENNPALGAHVAVARFFAENIASGAGGLELSVTEGAGGVHAAPLALAG